eukprot:CAMPEP_0194690634 /NCGR_PEP_ID=MMETSP0295-20121207/18461_1 /TAXON_ID=39354 /ORGANISM="Heterosigma akashiwo, Strain CCMP2393" /LENGTH=95 /DNA_ID=CAMNT_0039580179 /DNA_START=311 /DNA_END=598 /DNA_ORIENTATION=-
MTTAITSKKSHAADSTRAPPPTTANSEPPAAPLPPPPPPPPLLLGSHQGLDLAPDLVADGRPLLVGEAIRVFHIPVLKILPIFPLIRNANATPAH